MSARRNQNMVSGNQFAIDLNRIGIDECGKALYHFNAIFCQIVIVRAMNVFDVLLAAIH